ncbi:ATP synthase F1 subunit gamma [Candidatus Peregrinibacteria bacterium]|nr:ATP synthase F1 subunit gamma [Candidatus Peregrinibacteria bacterium]
MAKGTREIRRKIKSIKNTRQITKAMELVAASKMRRAVANTLALRPYARLAQALLANLSDKTSETLHPLLAKREVKKILVIAISTDRGLCGGLNTQLFRKFSEYLKSEQSRPSRGEAKLITRPQGATLGSPPEISFIAIGKKAQDFLRRTGQKVIAAYGAMSNHPTLRDSYAVSRMALQDYMNGVYDKIMLIYTNYISVVNQKPSVRRLLPLSRYALEEMVLEMRAHGASAQAERESGFASSSEAELRNREYLFEPSPDRVLEMLLPRLTEMQVYQAILEAAASEHSARMFAMRNASDNASEFIDDLTLAYNQIRQASITAELAEISAGRAALG